MNSITEQSTRFGYYNANEHGEITGVQEHGNFPHPYEGPSNYYGADGYLHGYQEQMVNYQSRSIRIEFLGYEDFYRLSMSRRPLLRRPSQFLQHPYQDHHFDGESFVQYQRSKRICHPIAGAAPFITCWNCFEPLKIPKKIMGRGGNFPTMKMRCGDCSSTIFLELDNLGTDESARAQIEQVSGEKSNENMKNSGGFLCNFASEDFDNPLIDSVIAIETDVSYQEFVGSGVFQDTTEISKEEDQAKDSVEGGDSFAGPSRSGKHEEDGKPDVFVNGEPITELAVKRAERLAGPIQPGDYWYDFQAGFWGVMGHHCLGILPPFIEEFKSPMPENCANGDTDVLVNGRELHRKDLELLADRGLPVTRHKSYLILISGRVFDNQNGEELERLGKLAPTVMKAKRGFGMRVPSKLAKQPC